MAGATTTPSTGGTGNPNCATPSNSTNNPNAPPGTGKSWELSDYELHRTPQEAITDASEIAVSPRALHSELMCPICLDMLHETMTTKECLHRFCAECIITALRSGNKECPTCRKKLVSKRSLRRDPNFDMLISKIYPSREEYEQQQQKAIARLSKSHNQLALATSIEEGLRLQQSQNRKFAKANKGKEQGGGSGAASNSNAAAEGNNNSQDVEVGAPEQSERETVTTPQQQPSTSTNGQVPKSGTIKTSSVGGDGSSHTSDEITEVELVFKPHPDMVQSASGSELPQGQFQTRFIKTSANASVEHLNKYLGMRLGLELDVDVGSDKRNHIACSTWIAPNGQFIRIPPGLTLGQICDKYWRFNKPLEVFYCVSFVKKDDNFV